MTGFIQAIIKNPTRSLALANKGDSVVLVKGELLAYDTGLAVPADSGTVKADIIGICNQDIAAAEALTQVPYIEIFENDVFVVDSTNNSNVAHNGQLMVLTDSTHVNNTGTTDADGIVEQVGVFGAAADKKILVKFV